ncbi:MAG: 3-dehydroquinate synthase [Candidatus Omnitrophota bacterium]|nr:MAG: 3-dehydroquinate synthase [Candidatus Omnitrophota bacterium]
MKEIKLNLKKNSYDILVGNNLLKALGATLIKSGIGKNAYIITNAFLKKKYGNKLAFSLLNAGLSIKFKLVPDSEKSKSIQQAYSIIRELAKYDKKKRIFIIAFGGGVIGDLSGFVASIYKRGLPYVQVPSTLLAQVDSAIGGKTAVDLNEGKNLVGAFYQPKLVFSDVSLLKTLNPRQIKSGLAEVVKYGMIKDRGLFLYIEKNYKKILSLKEKKLEFIVAACSKIKAEVVRRDEREEKGIRTILNFGHSIGHAIEAASGYKGYNHGEAVAIGMLVACDISKSLGMVNEKVCLRLEKLIKQLGLPTAIKGIKIKKLFTAFYRDKKFIGAKNRLVLLKNIGKTKIVSGVPLKVIKKAVASRMAN